MAELDAAIGALSRQQATGGDAAALVDRVLWPGGPAESHGTEDARFVRFTDGAEPAYCATYPAYDGGAVAAHLLETADFRTFAVSPLAPSMRRRARGS